MQFNILKFIFIITLLTIGILIGRLLSKPTPEYEELQYNYDCTKENKTISSSIEIGESSQSRQ